jgi:transitional endoplasmic reticulum ATPase
MPLAQDVDLALLSGMTERFTGADLEDLTRRAGLAALKRSLDSDTVTMADFEAALKDTRASVTEAMEKDYEKIQGEIKQKAMSVDPIGFFAPGMLKPVREQKHGDDSKS